MPPSLMSVVPVHSQFNPQGVPEVLQQDVVPLCHTLPVPQEQAPIGPTRHKYGVYDCDFLKAV